MEAIVTRGLSKRYRDAAAVEGLDLTVHRGELFALLGVNGADVYKRQALTVTRHSQAKARSGATLPRFFNRRQAASCTTSMASCSFLR